MMKRMVSQTSTAAPRVALPWIVRLRYAMATGQIVTAILVNSVLQIDLPLRWILIAPLLVILSNLWLARRPRSAESALIAWMFVLDTLGLTSVLLLTGGPTNPFTLLYLVHITLSATILNQRQTWGIGGLALLCFGLLFWRYRPIAALEMHHLGTGVNLHLIGMWAAFAVASLLVAMFSGKISSLLRQNEESLLRMQEELARKDRLASLVTLAAGAAHELSTPLGTIAVVAKDLERYATASLHDSAVAEDSRLIRTEVDRCSAILQRLSIDGAEPAGEAFEDVGAEALLASVRNLLVHDSLLIEVSEEGRKATLNAPRHAVEQALVALAKNAIEASPAGASVRLSASKDRSVVRFEVRDQGSGMSQETLRHAGEPFFTTKEPGKGMGLGIFLVRTLADRLGGRLSFQSEVGSGTSAVLELPVNEEARASA
jgi:two-component system sensor histidine kinase RegB